MGRILNRNDIYKKINFDFSGGDVQTTSYGGGSGSAAGNCVPDIAAFQTEMAGKFNPASFAEIASEARRLLHDSQIQPMVSFKVGREARRAYESPTATPFIYNNPSWTPSATPGVASPNNVITPGATLTRQDDSHEAGYYQYWTGLDAKGRQIAKGFKVNEDGIIQDGYIYAVSLLHPEVFTYITGIGRLQLSSSTTIEDIVGQIHDYNGSWYAGQQAVNQIVWGNDSVITTSTEIPNINNMQSIGLPEGIYIEGFNGTIFNHIVRVWGISPSGQYATTGLFSQGSSFFMYNKYMQWNYDAPSSVAQNATSADIRFNAEGAYGWAEYYAVKDGVAAWRNIGYVGGGTRQDITITFDANSGSDDRSILVRIYDTSDIVNAPEPQTFSITHRGAPKVLTGLSFSSMTYKGGIVPAAGRIVGINDFDNVVTATFSNGTTARVENACLYESYPDGEPTFRIEANTSTSRRSVDVAFTAKYEYNGVEKTATHMTVITQEAYKEDPTPEGAYMTGITLSVTRVSNAPASGRTMTYEDCDYSVTGIYSNGETALIYSSSDTMRPASLTMGGSLVVAETLNRVEHDAGTMRVTASYEASNGTFTAYQDVAVRQDGANVHNTIELSAYELELSQGLAGQIYVTSSTDWVATALGSFLSVSPSVGRAGTTRVQVRNTATESTMGSVRFTAGTASADLVVIIN